jgi:hypothetical protein
MLAENLGEHRTKPVAVHETFELSKVSGGIFGSTEKVTVHVSVV